MTNWLEIGLSNALLATGLAVVAWVVTRFCRHPKVVFTVWLLVLARLLVPPILGIPWQGWRVAELVETTPEAALYALAPPAMLITPSESDPSPRVATRQTFQSPSLPTSDPPGAQPAPVPSTQPNQHSATLAAAEANPWPRPSLGTLLGIVWISGSVLWLLLAIVRIVRFNRTLARAQLAPTELQSEVAALAERMRLRRPPKVRLVKALMPPLVWALVGRATIVLPSALMQRLSPEQRATLLAHELAHLARRDHFVRLLEMAALAVYWWHPVAWFARRQIARAGEECCDAAVIARFPDQGRAYAGAVLATVDFLAGARPAVPVGSSGFSQVSQLRRRLEMILAETVLRRVNWPLRLSLAALALVVLSPSIHSVAAAPKTFQPKSGTIEQRLDRLEKAMQELTKEIRAMHKAEMANAEPIVIKTVPETGAEDVDPNLTEIKVTFNKDMRDGSWSWTQRGSIAYPEVTGKPHYIDKRTCVLPVKLEANTTYYIGLNSERFKNFKDTSLRPAIPYPLTFKTK